MYNVVNCFRERPTFLVFEGSTYVAKKREYAANVYIVLLRGSGNNNDAVKVNQCKLPLDG